MLFLSSNFKFFNKNKIQNTGNIVQKGSKSTFQAIFQEISGQPGKILQT